MSMTDYDRALYQWLQTWLTDRRLDRFAEVLKMRTRHFTVAIENLYQTHNASAVIRSCEAFGIQDVHVIEHENRFQANPEIALGTDQWLTIRRYESDDGSTDSTTECINDLKNRGYRIAALVLHEESVPLDSISVEEPTALLLGNEKDGLTQTAISQADVLVHLPMYGFVESFNVSVAAALALQQLTSALRASEVHWHLADEEREELMFAWTRKSVKHVERFERQFAEQFRENHDKE